MSEHKYNFELINSNNITGNNFTIIDKNKLNSNYFLKYIENIVVVSNETKFKKHPYNLLKYTNEELFLTTARSIQIINVHYTLPVNFKGDQVQSLAYLSFNNYLSLEAYEPLIKPIIDDVEFYSFIKKFKTKILKTNLTISIEGSEKDKYSKIFTQLSKVQMSVGFLEYYFKQIKKFKFVNFLIEDYNLTFYEKTNVPFFYTKYRQ